MENQEPQTNNEAINSSDEKVSKTGSRNVFIFGSIAVFVLVGFFSAAAYYLGTKTANENNKTETTVTPEVIIEATASPTAGLSISPMQTLAVSLTPTISLSATATLTPSPTPTSVPKADLKINDYKFSSDPNNPVQGEVITISFSIYNQGNKPSGPFYWEWWPTKYAADTVNCRKRIDNLVARGGRVVSCTYTYNGWSNAYATKAVADADNEVEESDETNNTSERTIAVTKSGL